ncbi:MAG: CBS domain-containing protein [Myxococcota bacterium]
MTRNLVVLHEWENLLDVAQDMERYRLRHLPVVDGKELVGLVSHRDLLRFTATALDGSVVRDVRDQQLKGGTFVRSIMTPDVTTVHPDSSVLEAVRTLIESRFGCLPVVDEKNELVGIVSEHDLLKVLAGLLDIEAGSWSNARGAVRESPSIVDRETDPLSG